MLDKRYSLLAFVVALIVIVILFFARLSVPQRVKAVISPQNSDIESIDTARSSKNLLTFNLDQVNFPEGFELVHPRLGKLGYKDNFFIDFSGQMMVLKSGTYNFTVLSDDGFRLSIDGKTLSEFTGYRGMGEQSDGSVYLATGKHKFTLSYFQKSGPLGLKAYYGQDKSSKRYFIGQNSSLIKWSPR